MNHRLPKDYSREDMLFFNKKNYVCVGNFNEPIDSTANVKENNPYHKLMMMLKPGQYVTFKMLCHYPDHIETKRMVCVGDNKYHIIDRNQSVSYVRCYWNEEHQMVGFC